MDDLTKRLQAQGVKVRGTFNEEDFCKTLAMILSNKMGMSITFSKKEEAEEK